MRHFRALGVKLVAPHHAFLVNSTMIIPTRSSILPAFEDVEIKLCACEFANFREFAYRS